jgi:DNA-binding IclR family transcriptional regulator
MAFHAVKLRRAYPGTRAVRRAVGLLKAFAPERPQLRLVELSRAARLNKTTAFRLLTALESEGMVERSPDGDAYRLGPQLLRLGQTAGGTADLRQAARAELLRLAHLTRETATLEVLVGRDVLILEEAMGSHVVGATPSVGSRWPAHATSTGKALLAGLPPAEERAWLSRPLPALTARTITSPAALARELDAVRRRGYALSSGELEAGFVAVGAPVRSAAGEVVAAVSVGGPVSRIGPARRAVLAETVPLAAMRVSAALGYAAPGKERTHVREHEAGDAGRGHDLARAVLHRPRALPARDGADPLRHVAVRGPHGAAPGGGPVLPARGRRRQRRRPGR